MLSLVTEPDGNVVYLHADAAGIAQLERVLSRLKAALANGDCAHDHLHTPAWASDELSESMLGQEREKGCKQVHHLKIYGWTEEWASKHGLKKL